MRGQSEGKPKKSKFIQQNAWQNSPCGDDQRFRKLTNPNKRLFLQLVIYAIEDVDRLLILTCLMLEKLSSDVI